MSLAKKISIFVGIILLISALSVGSFVFGVNFTMSKFDINFQKSRIDKYVKLKQSYVLNYEGTSNQKIKFPIGTILYYEYAHKDFDSYASLRIKADFLEFERNISYIEQPGFYVFE
jgi:hypothetical protein